MSRFSGEAHGVSSIVIPEYSSSYRKSRGEFSCSRSYSCTAVFVFAQSLWFAGTEIYRSLQSLTIVIGILSRYSHTHMIPVIAYLVKHHVFRREHFQQPVQSPLGFVEHI